MTSILFLDVDGVLNTRPGSLDADKLDLLAGIVRETGCEIVLSSTWRKTEHQTERVMQALQERGMSLYGRTPVLEREIGKLIVAQVRWKEIQDWLNRHGAGGWPFVILDDEPDFGPLAGHHVRTRSDVGLTLEIAREVVGRLKGRVVFFPPE